MGVESLVKAQVRAMSPLVSRYNLRHWGRSSSFLRKRANLDKPSLCFPCNQNTPNNHHNRFPRSNHSAGNYTLFQCIPEEHTFPLMSHKHNFQNTVEHKPPFLQEPKIQSAERSLSTRLFLVYPFSAYTNLNLSKYPTAIFITSLSSSGDNLFLLLWIAARRTMAFTKAEFKT